MHKHITNNQLAGFLSETLTPGKRERVLSHLELCADCRKRRDMLFAAISPRYGSVRVDAAIKSRVMRSLSEAVERDAMQGPAGIRGLLVRHPRIALAGSLAVIAAAIVLGFFLARVPYKTVRIALSARQADEGITINNKAPILHEGIYDASTVRVPHKAMARLTYGDSVSIILIGPCVFSIDRFILDEGTNKIRLDCTLPEGLIISAIEERAREMQYTYKTPAARIDPLGTEFLLQAAGDSTLIVMKRGTVRVKPALSHEQVTVSAGNRCLITKQASISPAVPDDMKMFDDPNKLKSGVYAPRLLSGFSETRPAKKIVNKVKDDVKYQKEKDALQYQRENAIKNADKMKSSEKDKAVPQAEERKERAERQPGRHIQDDERPRDDSESLREMRRARRESSIERQRRR